MSTYVQIDDRLLDHAKLPEDYQLLAMREVLKDLKSEIKSNEWNKVTTKSQHTRNKFYSNSYLMLDEKYTNQRYLFRTSIEDMILNIILRRLLEMYNELKNYQLYTQYDISMFIRQIQYIYAEIIEIKINSVEMEIKLYADRLYLSYYLYEKCINIKYIIDQMPYDFIIMPNLNNKVQTLLLQTINTRITKLEQYFKQYNHFGQYSWRQVYYKCNNIIKDMKLHLDDKIYNTEDLEYKIDQLKKNIEENFKSSKIKYENIIKESKEFIEKNEYKINYFKGSQVEFIKLHTALNNVKNDLKNSPLFSSLKNTKKTLIQNIEMLIETLTDAETIRPDSINIYRGETNATGNIIEFAQYEIAYFKIILKAFVELRDCKTYTTVETKILVEKPKMISDNFANIIKCFESLVSIGQLCSGTESQNKNIFTLIINYMSLISKHLEEQSEINPNNNNVDVLLNRVNDYFEQNPVNEQDNSLINLDSNVVDSKTKEYDYSTLSTISEETIDQHIAEEDLYKKPSYAEQLQYNEKQNYTEFQSLSSLDYFDTKMIEGKRDNQTELQSASNLNQPSIHNELMVYYDTKMIEEKRDIQTEHQSSNNFEQPSIHKEDIVDFDNKMIKKKEDIQAEFQFSNNLDQLSIHNEVMDYFDTKILEEKKDNQTEFPSLNNLEQPSIHNEKMLKENRDIQSVLQSSIYLEQSSKIDNKKQTMNPENVKDIVASNLLDENTTVAYPNINEEQLLVQTDIHNGSVEFLLPTDVYTSIVTTGLDINKEPIAIEEKHEESINYNDAGNYNVQALLNPSVEINVNLNKQQSKEDVSNCINVDEPSSIKSSKENLFDEPIYESLSRNTNLDNKYQAKLVESKLTKDIQQDDTLNNNELKTPEHIKYEDIPTLKITDTKSVNISNNANNTQINPEEVTLKLIKLKDIEDRVQHLYTRLNNFNGSKQEDEYYSIDDDLTAIMIEIDNIPSDGYKIIKDKNRALLNSLNNLSDLYDQKCANAPPTLTDNEKTDKLMQINIIEDRLKCVHNDIKYGRSDFVTIDNLLLELFTKVSNVEDKKDDSVENAKKQAIKKIQNCMTFLSQKENYATRSE